MTQEIIDNRSKLQDIKFNFAEKHNFKFKRTQYYKDCIVIRWKTSRVKYEIVHDKINEYVDFCHKLCDKYNLWDEKDIFLDSDLRLIKAGIYVIYEYDYNVWAIPNEYKEIQDYIINNLPKWAKITIKK